MEVGVTNAKGLCLCDLFFLPDSSFIQFQLKQGHASLYKFMLAIVLYYSSLLFKSNYVCLFLFLLFLDILARSEPSSGGGVR